MGKHERSGRRGERLSSQSRPRRAANQRYYTSSTSTAAARRARRQVPPQAAPESGTRSVWDYRCRPAAAHSASVAISEPRTAHRALDRVGRSQTENCWAAQDSPDSSVNADAASGSRQARVNDAGRKTSLQYGLRSSDASQSRAPGPR